MFEIIFVYFLENVNFIVKSSVFIVILAPNAFATCVLFGEELYVLHYFSSHLLCSATKRACLLSTGFQCVADCLSVSRKASDFLTLCRQLETRELHAKRLVYVKVLSILSIKVFGNIVFLLPLYSNNSASARGK